MKRVQSCSSCTAVPILSPTHTAGSNTNLKRWDIVSARSSHHLCYHSLYVIFPLPPGAKKGNGNLRNLLCKKCILASSKRGAATEKSPSAMTTPKKALSGSDNHRRKHCQSTTEGFNTGSKCFYIFIFSCFNTALPLRS